MSTSRPAASPSPARWWRGAGKVVTEKDTKTHASRRLAIDEGTAAALQQQLERATARAQACGLTGLSPDGAVFPRRPDGSPWSPNDATKAFIRLRKAVGLPEVRLHDLRHFSATRLLAAGVPVRTVSGRLGHATASTTLSVYAHFVEQSDRDEPRN
jgi:integrase